MRSIALAFSVAVLLMNIPGASCRADDTAAEVHRTEHYELHVEGDLDAVDLGNLLEQLHATLTAYFGEAPGDRLRIEMLRDETRFKQALADAGEPDQDGGGYYSPAAKTAWLFIQPSEYFTRHLLLHEATHQFHYLLATGNDAPSAEWYREGLADYMGLHTWDGKQLHVGCVPLVSLEDFPAQAAEEFIAAEWALPEIVAGKKEIGRGAGWMLVHFLINRDYGTFGNLAARLDRREDPQQAFAETFGEFNGEMIDDLKQWVTERQQPFEDIWVEWQPWGDNIEGHSESIALCLVKRVPRRFEAEIQHVVGELKSGIAFGYQSPENLYVLQIRSDRHVHLLQREAGIWHRLSKTPLAHSTGYPTLRIDQLDQQRVALYANNKEVQRLSASGRVGLTVDGCRARFRVKGAEPGAHLSLTELIDPNQRSADGRTLLHQSILDEDTGKVERLLFAGADVEVALENGVTPIMMAAFKNNVRAAQLLLVSGADVKRATSTGTTALHYAAAGGNPELVGLLLDAGASIDAKKPGGTTPLILAAQHGRVKAIVALVDAGADVNARLAGRNITGLMLAAQNGHTAAVCTLLDRGAEWRAKDWQGRTALDYATANERTAVVDALRSARESAEQTSGSTAGD
jgi:hypothetical protein